MKTSIKLKPISIDEMLNNKEDSSYNVSTWKNSVNRYAKYDKCQFYTVPKEPGVFDYNRFYVSYVAEGIYFFKEWRAFSSSLTSNGFCKVVIDFEGNVEKYLFKDINGKEGYAENCEANRKMFRNSLTPNNIMVSNCI